MPTQIAWPKIQLFKQLFMEVLLPLYSLCVCFGTKQSKTFALTSLKKECGFHGKPHINWLNQWVSWSVSWSWVGDKQIMVCLSAIFPRITLPNQSESRLGDQSKKAIPWFIHIDLISDLIDDLINLIKSMTTLRSRVPQTITTKRILYRRLMYRHWSVREVSRP